MYYGTLMPVDFAEVWRQGLKDWDGNVPERMLDDEQERAFWERYIAEKRASDAAHAPDPYAAGLLPHLLELVAPGEDVLEIGPGWGNYTFDVAAKAGRVTCFDISPDILDYLGERAARRGLANLAFACGRWEESALDADSHDLVFGINCFYRMQDIAGALARMDRAARRLAVVGLTSGPEPIHLRRIETELGYRINYARRDYIHLLNVLYGLGIDANCTIVPLSRTYTFTSLDEILDKTVQRIRESAVDRDAVARILADHVAEIDGRPGYTHRFTAALISWAPQQLEGV